MGSLQITGPAAATADRAYSSAPELKLNSTFNGRYQILSELGRGAMGVVYKAQDIVIGRTVALKTIAVGHSSPNHSEIIERLKSEAKTAGSLDHPNIITIYDVGHDGDRVYLSMQYVEGSTLATMLDGKNLRPGQLTLLSYAEQICNAVAFAHERGVVHRDLKPSNLMLTPQGQIKVLDFGIAKKGDASLTQHGMVVGTPSYMAPEQATGKDVDYRCDIFSLGALLYELFTGKKAFHADSVTAVLYKVVHEQPEPPAAVDPTVPPGIDAAIRRALEKDPSQRFQSCVELRDTLRKEAVFLRTSSAKMLAKPLLESGKHKKIAGKGRSRYVLVGLLAAVVLLAAAGAYAWPRRSKMPRLMHFISYLQHFRKHQPSSEPGADTSAQTGNAATVKTGDPASTTALSTSPASEPSTKSETPQQDASAASPQSVPAQLQPVPTQSAAEPTDTKASHDPAATAQPHSGAAQESKAETEAAPAASTEEQAASESASEPADTTTAPKRRVVPPAPTVVEGFTRKDIPDLLRKADAAAGSGEYKIALYEYDIVLRLDRANARARDGVRRAREAEKERR